MKAYFSTYETKGRIEKFLMQNNSIVSVDKASFKGLPALRIVSFAYNNLEHLPARLFTAEHTLLETVRFDNNMLRSLPERVFVEAASNTSNLLVTLSFNLLSGDNLRLTRFLYNTSVSYIDVSYNRMNSYPYHDLDVFRLTRSKSAVFMVLDGNNITAVKGSFCGALKEDFFAEAPPSYSERSFSLGLEISLRNTNLTFVRNNAFLCNMQPSEITGDSTGTNETDGRYLPIILKPMLELDSNFKLKYLPNPLPSPDVERRMNMISLSIRNTSMTSLPYGFNGAQMLQYFNYDQSSVRDCCRFGFDNAMSMVTTSQMFAPRTTFSSFVSMGRKRLYEMTLVSALNKIRHGVFPIQETFCYQMFDNGTTSKIAVEDLDDNYAPRFPCSCAMIDMCSNERFYGGQKGKDLKQGKTAGKGSRCTSKYYPVLFSNPVENHYCTCEEGYVGDGYYCTNEVPWPIEVNVKDQTVYYTVFAYIYCFTMLCYVGTNLVLYIFSLLNGERDVDSYDPKLDYLDVSPGGFPSGRAGEDAYSCGQSLERFGDWEATSERSGGSMIPQVPRPSVAATAAYVTAESRTVLVPYLLQEQEEHSICGAPSSSCGSTRDSGMGNEGDYYFGSEDTVLFRISHSDARSHTSGECPQKSRLLAVAEAGVRCDALPRDGIYGSSSNALNFDQYMSENASSNVRWSAMGEDLINPYAACERRHGSAGLRRGGEGGAGQRQRVGGFV